MSEVEQLMKKELDGWFFTFNVEKQKTRAVKVPKDHIPSHKPKTLICLESPGRGAKVWSKDEDELLFEMFYKGFSFKVMAQALQISQALANNRFRHLCLQRGIEPKRRPVNSKFSIEDEARLVELKHSGMTFDQIAERLGLTRNQVAGVWLRYKKTQEMMEDAA